MTLPPDHAFSVSNCKLVLDEALGLLEVMRRSEPGMERLKFSLANHFTKNDFRSFCCHGNGDDDVSLETFNSLCTLPPTDGVMRLNGGSTAMQPEWIGPPFSPEQKFKLVSANMVLLVTNILETHPDGPHVTAQMRGDIGSPWILAVLGRNRDISSGDFFVPPLPELRRRICLSLLMVLLFARGPALD